MSKQKLLFSSQMVFLIIFIVLMDKNVFTVSNGKLLLNAKPLAVEKIKRSFGETTFQIESSIGPIQRESLIQEGNNTHILNVSSTNLVELEDSLWMGNGHILVVDASHNSIETVGSLHSDTVEHIILRDGELKQVQRENFKGLVQLHTLELHNNRYLTQLDLDVPTLMNLDVSNCGLTEFSGFDQLTNLKTLNISFNRIKSINEKAIIAITKLEALDLSHNDITFIDEFSFIRQVRLQYLNLSWNKIDRTDWSITLKNITYLDISHNIINNIDILMLRRVKYLNVSHNKLLNLPAELGLLLPQLQVLDASSNPIRTINFIKSAQLTTLNLRECKIHDIGKDAFKDAVALSFLDIADNKLRNSDFLQSLQNVNVTIVDDNPWQCVCNVSLELPILCQPSNLSRIEFCEVTKEIRAKEDPWFVEAANPVIWAPLVVALVIVVVACFGFRTYKNSRRNRAVTSSYEFLPIDLIRNIPEEVEEEYKLFRAWLRWGQALQSNENEEIKRVRSTSS